MHSLLQHLPWRVFWLLFMGAIATFFLATSHGSLGALVLGAGYIIFGFSLFLQPIRFNVPMRQNLQELMKMPTPFKLLSRLGLLLILVGSLLWLRGNL